MSVVVVVLSGDGVGYDDEDEGLGMILKGVVVDGGVEVGADEEVRVLLRASFEEVSVLILVLVVVGTGVGSVLGVVGFA